MLIEEGVPPVSRVHTYSFFSILRIFHSEKFYVRIFFIQQIRLFFRTNLSCREFSLGQIFHLGDFPFGRIFKTFSPKIIEPMARAKQHREQENERILMHFL